MGSSADGAIRSGVISGGDDDGKRVARVGEIG